MPTVLAYLFAAVGAGCLFTPYGFLWLLPALFIASAAHFTRAMRVASWTVAVFAGLLAFWSAWALCRALEPEGVGIIVLGATPLMQIFVIVAVLLPLLLSICGRYHLIRPHRALQQKTSPPPRRR